MPPKRPLLDHVHYLAQYVYLPGILAIMIWMTVSALLLAYEAYVAKPAPAAPAPSAANPTAGAAPNAASGDTPIVKPGATPGGSSMPTPDALPADARPHASPPAGKTTDAPSSGNPGATSGTPAAPADGGAKPAPAVKEAWVDYLIRPVVQSRFNRIVFQGTFLILVWVTLFFIVPVAFLRLEKFRLFNLEFEVERDKKEQEAVEKFEMNAGIAYLMAYLSGEDFLGRTYPYIRGDTFDYWEALHAFLREIQLYYQKNFGKWFTFHVYPDDAPRNVQALAEASRESGHAVIRNKSDPDNPYAKNHLVLYSKEKQLILRWSSYSSSFSVMDGYLLETFHNLFNRNVDLIEYEITLTTPSA